MAEQTKQRVSKNRKPSDWIGLKFSRLTIMEIVGKEGRRNSLVCMAKCDCGELKRVRIDSLRDGMTRSCGCLRDEINSLPTEKRPKAKRSDKRSHEEKRAAQIRWVKANPEKVAEAAKRHRLRNKDRVKRQKAEEYQRRKASVIEKINKRYAQDERFRVESLIRSRIRKVISRRGAVKSARSIELLGCSIEFFMLYVESLFLPGMSWENRSEWHLDHRTPCAAYDLTDPEQQKICFNYKNLQPLWAIDNLSKKARLDWTHAESKRVTAPPAPGTQAAEYPGPQAST